MNGVVQRGTELLESLRQFSRQTKDAPQQEFDLDRVAHEAMTIAKTRAASGRRALPYFVEDFHHPPVVWGRAAEVVAALVKIAHEDPEEMVRREAVETLGDLQGPEGLQALRALSKSEDPAVRDEVAETLHDMAERAQGP